MGHESVGKIILIGTSTGGPGHLRQIVSALDGSLEAAVVIAQHMDRVYLPSFAKQIGELCSLNVQLVSERTILEKGRVYICAVSMALHRCGAGAEIGPAPAEGPYNPDIDGLFASSAFLAGDVEVMGIILTGIGDDGAQGCLRLSEAGGRCIAESEESAVVYGMPKRVLELNPGVSVLPLGKIIAAILAFGSV